MFVQRHIYKSLSLADFMEHFSFVLTRSGYYALPVIQTVNWLKKVNQWSQEEAKAYFLNEIRRYLDLMEENDMLYFSVQITPYERYYEVTMVEKGGNEK